MILGSAPCLGLSVVLDGLTVDPDEGDDDDDEQDYNQYGVGCVALLPDVEGVLLAESLYSGDSTLCRDDLELVLTVADVCDPVVADGCGSLGAHGECGETVLDHLAVDPEVDSESGGIDVASLGDLEVHCECDGLDDLDGVLLGCLVDLIPIDFTDELDGECVGAGILRCIDGQCLGDIVVKASRGGRHSVGLCLSPGVRELGIVFDGDVCIGCEILVGVDDVEVGGFVDLDDIRLSLDVRIRGVGLAF